VRNINFGEPWIGHEEIELVRQTLCSHWFGQGPLVEEFELNLADYVGATEAVAVSSCTAALHLSLIVAGVGPGDEVITTPMTFVATVNAIEHVGATPVLVDINPHTLLLDIRKVEQAITPRTKAIIPVSFGGHPIDTDAYIALAREHNLWVIEDAAHSLGAVSSGLRVGADRDDHYYLTCFSFYPNKNVASAEGGAITTSSPAIAQRLRRLRVHGLDVDAWTLHNDDAFEVGLAVEAGYKYNWTDLQAAIAIPQLMRLEWSQARRDYLAGVYDEYLDEILGIRRLERCDSSPAMRHALHLYPIRVPRSRRNEIVKTMRTNGIGVGIHYVGVNLHPHFATLKGVDVPNSDEASHELISLPIHTGMNKGDVVRVVATLQKVLKQ
jgi:dTDP-4-amino-4,6-dideoxygalactose transaminase